jgi:hypothetical protein
MNSLLLTLLVVGALFLSGCDALFSTAGMGKSTSQGGPYEVVAICNQPLWEGALGDSLRVIMRAEDPYLNSREPLFNLFQVTPHNLTKIVDDHRNKILLEVDPSLDQTTSRVEYDVTATPQMVLTLRGASPAALTDYVSANRESLVQLFEKAERDRSIAYAKRFNETSIAQQIKETFGVEMDVPKGYVLAKQTEDFMWMRYEFPSASQGFMLYSYPYQGRMSLSEGELQAARLKYAAEIPGPSEGSYMTTSPVISPIYRLVKIDGRIWAELRGFWDVEGDFMGGPFVSYSTLDEATDRVFTIDCYIYSPKLDKRNFLRSVEHLVYMIRFPESSSVE